MRRRPIAERTVDVEMAESSEFTRCLLELPKISVNDLRRIVRVVTSTPQSLMEKGFKFYVCSYITGFEGKLLMLILTLA